MSARTARLIATALAAVLLTAGAEPPRRFEQYQQLRKDAAEAAKAGDLETAEARLEAALALYPEVPGSYIRLARVQAVAGKTDEALDNLAAYASLGLRLDVGRDPALKPLMELPGYAAIAGRLAENGKPIGELTTVATIEGRPELMAEGLVRDGDGWLLSTVAGRTIVRVTGDETKPFLQGDADTGALFGMAADRERALLWVAEAWGPLAPGTTGETRSDLLKVSLADGRILGRYPLPAGNGQLGDVAVGPDGTVYAADSTAGGIWRLRPGATALDRVIEPGRMGSPQGLVVCPGGGLLVADYSTGLNWIDTETGDAAGAGGLVVGLAGTDALIPVPGFERDGEAASFAVLATQNGVSPQRVVLMRITTDCTTVLDSKVIAANHDAMDDLTLAAIDGGKVVFVAHSRWAERDAEGKATTDAPPPIRILSVPLPASIP